MVYYNPRIAVYQYYQSSHLIGYHISHIYLVDMMGPSSWHVEQFARNYCPRNFRFWLNKSPGYIPCKHGQIRKIRINHKWRWQISYATNYVDFRAILGFYSRDTYRFIIHGNFPPFLLVTPHAGIEHHEVPRAIHRFQHPPHKVFFVWQKKTTKNEKKKKATKHKKQWWSDDDFWKCLEIKGLDIYIYMSYGQNLVHGEGTS